MALRLFTCLVPASPVVEALDAFVAPRRGPELRWTRPDTWHVTTSFMGAVRERDVLPLVEELSAVVLPPLRVELGGAGAFPSVDRARQLWVGVREGADAVAALAQKARHAAVRAGVEVSGGRFVAHLTVARTKRPVEATKWLRVLSAWEGAGWSADEFVLIQSNLADGANRYEVLARMPLVGSGG